jgi:hypothetical protein
MLCWPRHLKEQALLKQWQYKELLMTRHDGNGGVMGPKPTRHEGSGLFVGGPVGILIVWLLASKGIPVPEPVAAAIGSLAAQAVHYLSTFLPRRNPR